MLGMQLIPKDYLKLTEQKSLSKMGNHIKLFITILGTAAKAKQGSIFKVQMIYKAMV